MPERIRRRGSLENMAQPLSVLDDVSSTLRCAFLDVFSARFPSLTLRAMFAILFGRRAELAVARVTQTRNDIALFVQVVVEGGEVNRHLGMGRLHGADSFRGGDQGKHLEP